MNISKSIITDSSQPYDVPTYLNTFINSKNNTLENPLYVPLLSNHEVFKIVHNLKNKKTMDVYYLNSYILKLSVSQPHVCTALTHVYNLSILNETFPNAFKLAKIIPIPKTKEVTSLDNLRPISILPILSKPLEYHFNSHLNNFLENNNLFIDNQSGFRAKHSCTSALINLCDSWLQSINDKKIVGSVFLDLRKAFDLVNHNILISKLHAYLGSYKNFFESYLLNRSQTVCINSKFSKIGMISTGVPQGSILGPTLFSVFINDLPLSLSNPEAIMDLFADDSTLHSSSTDISILNFTLQNSLNDIDKWCDDNKMALHPNKTKSMLITSRQKRQIEHINLTLNINGNRIEQVRTHKLLGVLLDDEFSWTNHIDYISKKVSRNIYLLSQLKHYVSSDALLTFYHAHCMSHLNYSSTLWSTTSNVNLYRLNSLHRRAVKIVNNKKDLSTNMKFLDLNLLNLNNQHFLNTAILMYRVFHEDCPNYLKNLFTTQPIVARLRAPNFKVPFARINLFKGSFAFKGATIWNSLPARIRFIPKLNKFKNETKKMLLSKQLLES